MADDTREDSLAAPGRRQSVRPGPTGGSGLEGTRVAGRFRVERFVGRGGMGTVYLAHDEQTDRDVALKMMGAHASDARRFDREASVLASLDHPIIVRHVAHGRSEHGQPYLAMEWVEGTPLGDRLATGPLSVAETIALANQIAAGLIAVHAVGAVHRDIKPSNIMLVSGDAAAVKLVDFGVARTWALSTAVTQTGTMVGTVGYMAPEQAQGLNPIDARADLFALGCVLYECLTGTPPFSATSPVAVLARVLLESPPPISTLRPDCPPPLVALIDRLLAKAPEDRPASAREALHVLRSLEAQALVPTEIASSPAALRSTEVRMTTVLLIDAGAPQPPDESGESPRGGIDPERISALVASHGAEVVRLVDGTTVIVFDSGGGPAERAGRAARCAFRLRDELPDRAIVLTTGRAASTSRAAVGLALDKGGELLAHFTEPGEIGVDELTARLLGARFGIDQAGEVWRLREEVSTDEAPAIRRRLLGRDVACVGRRKELLLLEATYEEVEEDGVMRVVLVTGPAGIGKSRLAAEVHSRLALRGARRLLARATPLTMGSSGAMLRTLVRSAAGIADGEAHEVAWAQLESYVTMLGLDEPMRSTEILGELVGIPSPATPSVALKAARDDPKVLRYWLTQVLPQWLRAECAREPLVIVLEDTQWADAATVSLLDLAFAEMHEVPLLLIALARPEVHERFDVLVRNAPVQEVPLFGLSRRASEQLVRAALADIDAHVLDNVLDRAGGNPFFLEELVRAVAAGRQDLPDTVLAVAEEHLQRVPAESRRVLRAASVFGESCRASGVAALLGDREGTRTSSLLDELVTDEILDKRKPERPGVEPTFAFRHILLRDAAYAMVPAEERANAHALVAAWLSTRGDAEPGLLAEHFNLAGDHTRAARQFKEAAAAAYARGDLAGASEHCRRGLALEPSDDTKGKLYFTLGYAKGFGARFEEMKAAHRAAVPLLPKGSRVWVEAVAGLAYGCSLTSDAEGLREAMALFQTAGQDLEVCGAGAFTLTVVTSALLLSAGPDAARPFERAAVAMDAQVGDADPIVRGWSRVASGILALHSNEPCAGRRSLKQAVESFAAAGDPIGLSLSSGILALLCAQLGLRDEATENSASVRTLSRQGVLAYATSYADFTDALLQLPNDADAGRKGLEQLFETSSLNIRNYAMPHLVSLALAAGDTETVRRLCTALEGHTIPSTRKAIEIALGLRAIDLGEIHAARVHLERCEGPSQGEAILHGLALARDQLRLHVHRASGDTLVAEDAAKTARRHLRATAATLLPEERMRFWTDGFDIPQLVSSIEKVLGKGAVHDSDGEAPAS